MANIYVKVYDVDYSQIHIAIRFAPGRSASDTDAQ